MIEQPPENIDIAQEKKKNTKLAIIVAAVGVAGFMLMYLIFFMAMFLFPFALFSLMPFQSISTEAADINGRLFVFSRQAELKGASFKERPKEKTVMQEAALPAGEKKALPLLSEPVEIKPFYSISAADGKAYFFAKGLYRIYDGKNWTEVRIPAIGENPIGAVNEQGIWVLSEFNNAPGLKLLTEDSVSDMPLPEFDESNKLNVRSAQLEWLKDELYLFWKKDHTLFIAKYSGGAWSSPQSMGEVQKYRVLSRDEGGGGGEKLLLFTGSQDFKVLLTAFNGTSWSEPIDTGIKEMAIDFHTTVAGGKPVLLAQGFFSKNLYFINGDKTEGPYVLQSFLRQMLSWKLVLIFLIPFFVYLGFILLLSAIIGKHKLRRWMVDSKEVEFASLWRRFLAKTVDGIIVPLPLGLYLLYKFFTGGLSMENPFEFFGLIFLAFAVVFIGGFLYHSLMEGLWGKTIGKKLCGIVVLREDFTKCTIGRGFLRNFMRIIDSLFYYLAGVITIMATLKWQRLGDMVSGTIVVREGAMPRADFKSEISNLKS